MVGWLGRGLDVCLDNTLWDYGGGLEKHWRWPGEANVVQISKVTI